MPFVALSHAPGLGHRRTDVGPVGLVIAAAIVAAFFADAVRAAPVQVTVSESQNLEVVLTVVGDAAPTFQVYRQPGGSGGPGGTGNAAVRFVVELPGSTLQDGALAVSGPGMLLHEARAEAASRGATGRVLLTFSDDVDFDADTHKRTLAVRFHHTGDRAALQAAHQQRLAELAAVAADAVRREVARREAEKAAETARLAKLEEDNKRKLADDARAAAVAEAARIAKLEDEKKHLTAQQAEAARKAREAEAARLAQLEADKKKQQQADEAARLARIEADKKKQADEAARLARLEADKKKQQQADEAARLAKIADEKRKADEAVRLARLEAEQKARADEAARREQLARAEAAKEAARVAQLELEKKKQADEAARLARLAETQKQQADEAARLKKLEAEQKARADEAARLQQARDEEARIARQREQERARAVEAARSAQAGRPTDDEPGFGGTSSPAVTRPTPSTRTTTPTPTPTTATTTATAPQDAPPVRLARATPPPKPEGFGGGRAVEFSRGGTRYQRVELPKEASDDDGYGDDDSNDGDDDGDLDESVGRSVLSQVTVQRMAGGARVGIRVDGGARYHVARRGRGKLVLTLVDTRAQNLDVRRVLDARSMGGPVLRVLPTVDEDRRFRIELVIETRGQNPVKIQQDGQFLWLEVME